MDLVTFLLLCLVLVLSYYLFFYTTPERRRVEELVNKLPGPKRLPIIGTTRELLGVSREDIFAVYLKRNDVYGPLFRSWNVSIPCVHVMKAEHVEVILRDTKNLAKGAFYQFFRGWLKEGLITVDSVEKWHRHRKLLTPTFHLSILDTFTQVMVEKAEILISQLSKKANGEFFNIYSYITNCALDIITETAMGVQTNAQTNPKSEYVRAVLGMTQLVIKRIFSPHLHSDFIFNLTAGGKLYRQYLSTLHGNTRKVIQERQAQVAQEDADTNKKDELIGKKKRRVFLDLLLETNKVNPQLTDEELTEEVETFMFAGHDTITVTTCWTLFTLANYPEVQKRLHQELDEVLQENESINPQNLAKMQYLERVIKETMRIFPTVPIIVRSLTSDIQLDQYIIPKSTMIVLQIYNLHRDPKQFPDPLKFDPDRFLPERSSNRHPYAFIPFSAGPRNCLGQKFAVRCMKTLLASIVKNYEIKALETPETVKVYGELAMRPQNGMIVALTPRKPT